MAKRVIAMLLAVCLLCAGLSTVALAAGQVHTEENGNVIYEEKPDSGFSLNSVQMLVVEVVIIIGICVGAYFLFTRKR